MVLKYGIEKEEQANFCYCKIMEKKHRNFNLKQTGLVLSSEYGWIGASPDGIRTCACCVQTLVEFKCPLTGKDMDPKTAFLLDSVGGPFNCRKNHIHYFQIQTGMAVCGLKKCDFVVFTNKGIFVANIAFNEDFWKSTISTVQLFYTRKIISTLLLQLATNINSHC